MDIFGKLHEAFKEMPDGKTGKEEPSYSSMAVPSPVQERAAEFTKSGVKSAEEEDREEETKHTRILSDDAKKEFDESSKQE